MRVVSGMDNIDEKELLTAARKGNKEAFGRIVMIHQKRLLRTVLLIVGSRDAAMDIVQESFIKAWRALGRFDPERPFYPWLATIGRNLAINYVKRSGREQSLEDLTPENLETADTGNNPLDRLLTEETNKKFAAALQTLPEQFRTVFVLRMYERMSYQEIAGELGISPGTVDSRLYRAREKLMELLKDELE